MCEDQAKSTELEEWSRSALMLCFMWHTMHSLFLVSLAGAVSHTALQCIGGMHGTPDVRMITFNVTSTAH